MSSPQARPTPPQREPLTYFGNWCGQGWSAGRESQSALSAADLKKPAIALTNRNGTSRPNPVTRRAPSQVAVFQQSRKVVIPVGGRCLCAGFRASKACVRPVRLTRSGGAPD